VGFLRWRRVFIVLPALVLLGYLLRSLPAVWEGLKQGRDFTPGQRLLTEGRVLWTYLRDIWLPRAHDGGLFHDDFSLSHGLLEPVSTLFAWFGIIVLVAWAVVARRARTDWVVASAAAIAFFLAGHLIESTWLQLELVFEHRNYLPAILMFWPLSLALLRGARDRAGKLRWPAWFALALLALFAAQTTRRAETWGEPFQQALQWAHEHPQSPRAQAYLADFWSRTGNQVEAARLLDAALSEHPGDLLLLIKRGDVACAADSVPRALRTALLHAVSTAGLGAPVTLYQFDRLLDTAGSCDAFGTHFQVDLLQAAVRNPAAVLPAVGLDLLHRQALLALSDGDATRAYAFDLRALRISTPPPGARLRFAAELASAGQQRLALQLLDAVPSPLEAIHGWGMVAWHQRWLRHVGFYQESERHLRAVLQREISHGAQSSAVKSIGDEHGTVAAASTAG
jgi:tetratricopeptide (TPR) repeat protein